jgi:hypothetical protein
MSQVNIARQVEAGPPVLLVSGPPKVTAMPAGYYLVQFSPQVRPRNHVVTKDRRCACVLDRDCPAVQAVRDYLLRGGARAPNPKPDSIIPAHCPICGGAVHFEPRLCSHVRGAGWVCLAAAKTETTVWPARYWCPGESHYWQHMWAMLSHLRFGRQERAPNRHSCRMSSLASQPCVRRRPGAWRMG